ncbi:Protein of unknown function [Alkalibacterium subtropicum]|uniref:DUF1475 domain-containing protein n=1 Tax=Alkalibacterium subtropicum TaxID=753702 RepID=A0A1I1FR23_9LACT|nr:DUF1475 family protein [Alkalibacterium subtropicum]SFC02009.1 Protein of unknown function [Alkalibacterium subtropicum]
MKAAKIVAWLCLLAMTAGLINAFVNGDFLVDGGALLANPWGVMAMIDLYVGFVLFSMWIVYREQTLWKISLWIVTLMIFGFLIGSIYVLKALYESEGDWTVALHGVHRGATDGKD